MCVCVSLWQESWGTSHRPGNTRGTPWDLPNRVQSYRSLYGERQVLRFNTLAVMCVALLVSCGPTEQEKAAPADSLGRESQALATIPVDRLQWSGATNPCFSCGTSTTYACSDDAPNWNNGEKTFTDPVIPRGDLVVVGVDVKVYGRSLALTAPNVTILLNGQQLGSAITPTPKLCSVDSDCDLARNRFLNNDAGVPGYVYGGTNTLKVQVAAGSSYCVSHADVTLTVKSRSIGVSPVSLDFGNQTRGTTSPSQTVTVTNTGEVPLNLGALTISGPFAVTPTAATQLAVGATRSLLVTFSPTTNTSAATGTLTIPSDDPSKPQVTVALSGTGVAHKMDINPTSLPFGNQRVGTPSTGLVVTVRNVGTGNLDVNNPTITGPFTVSPTTGRRLAAGASTEFTVTFTPTATGAALGGLTFSTADDPNRANFTVPLSGTGTKPTFTSSPASLSYGPQRVGSSSPPQKVTVSNTGNAPLVVSAPVITGNFAVSPSTGFTVEAGSSQELSVTFSPTALGSATGTLSLNTDDTANPSDTISLSGSGVAYAADITPTSLPFGNQNVGNASAPQVVTVRNAGSTSLQITGITITGPFAVTPTATPITLAAGATQDLSVTFSPTAQGATTGTLTIGTTDSERPSVAVSLSGTGVKPTLTLSPTALTFSSQRVGTPSAAQKVTVSNTGNAALSISSLTLTGPFTVSPSQPFNLAVGASQDLMVTFNPTATGSATGTLTLSSNDPDRLSAAISLSGTGVQPILGVSPSSLTFSAQRVGTPSTSQKVTVSNTGTGSIDITSVSIGNGQPFTVTPSSAFTLVAGASQDLFVTFSPTATGGATGTLTLATDYTLSPSALVSLSGTGVQPGLSVSPSSLAFGEQHVSVPSEPRKVTVSNTGTGPIRITGITLGGSQTFTVTPSVPFDLAAGTSQELSVTFTPTTETASTGTLTLTTDYSTTPSTSVSLSGTGVKPLIELNPTSLLFTDQRIGTPSTSQKVTVRNIGSGTLRISSLSFGAVQPFSVTPNTAFNVPAAGSVDLSVTFTPTAEGVATGTLTLATNEQDKPTVTVSLSGTGVKPVLGVSPSSLVFSEQRVDTTSAAQTVTVSNTGTGTIRITGLSIGAGKPFTVSPSTAFNLAPGTSQDLSVAFAPTAAGASTATLTLTTDYASPVTIALSGTGVKPIVGVNPTALVFGEQRVQVPSDPKKVMVSNTGSGPIRITAVSISGSQTFTVTPSAPFTLDAGTSEELSVTFTPTTETASTGTLTLTTDYASTPSFSVNLSGTGVKPTFTLSLTSLAFGEQAVGTPSAAQKVRVSNVGSGTLRITSLVIGSGEPFSVSPSSTPITLAAGAGQDLSVTFSPTATGPFTGTLTLTTNDLATPSATVSLSGTGVRPGLGLTPTSLSFGGQTTGTSSTPLTVKVTNTGNGILRIQDISLAAPFSVTPSQPFDLAAGASQFLSVTFSPTALGAVTGTLTFNTNDPATPSAAISLSGNGVSWIQTSQSGPLDFGKVRVNQESPRTVTLTNVSAHAVQLKYLSGLSGPFSTDLALPRTLLKGESATFTVKFKPTASQVFNSSLVVVSDAFNSPHELELVGTGVVPMVKLITPSNDPPTLDFGGVRLTTAGMQTVTLKNEGGAPLTITNPTVSTGSRFSYGGSTTLTVQPNASVDLQVTFNPEQSIPYNDTLRIPSDDPVNGTLLVSLVGKGTFSKMQVDRTAISFGDVRVGSESSKVAVKVSNPGTAPLTVQNLAMTGSFIAEGASPLPMVVPAGESRNVLVSFTPSVKGTQSGLVTILTDGNQDSTVDVTLQGNGTISEVTLSLPALDFGKQSVNQTSGVQPIIITNTGKATLEIKQFIINGVFSIAAPLPLPTEQAPLLIAAGEQKAVAVTFTPNTLGATEGKLYIVSNAFVTPQPLVLKGEGVDGQITFTPSVVTFEGVSVGSVGMQLPVVLKNTGSAALKLLGGTVQPADSSFSVSGLSPGQVLRPNDQVQLTVTFTPKTRGNLLANFAIQTDASINSIFNLALSGTGKAPAVVLQPPFIVFNKTNVAATSTQTLSIKNEGEETLYVSNISFTDTTQDGSGAALDYSTNAQFPITVPPKAEGGSAIVTLSFTPRQIGQRNATAVFYTNDRNVEASLQGEGTSARLKLEPAALDFGSVLVNNPSAPKDLTITNTGNGPLTLSSMTLGGADMKYFLMAPFQPITLPPGASTKVSLTLRPDEERPFRATLVVATNDAAAPTAEVLLSGGGVTQQIQLSDVALDFGQQLVRQTSSLRKVRVTNNSDTPVTLSGLAVDGVGSTQFALSRLTLPLSLPARQGQDVELRFTPLAEEEVSSTLKITFSEPPLQLEVALHGRGIPSVIELTPSPLEFGAVRVGGTRREQPLTITNLSSELIVLSAPEVTYNTGEPFLYNVDLVKGRAIEPGQSILVPISYNPQVETLSETTLAFGTSIPPKPRAVNLALKGRATLRLLSVDPGSLDFGRVDVDKPMVSKQLTILNKSAQQQRVVVMLKTLEQTPFSVEAKALADPIPAGGSATFTVSFDPEDAGAAENEVQVWLQGDTVPEALIAVAGHGRDLTGGGGGCSCDTSTGAAGMLALLALVGLGSRRRRRA